MTILLCEGASPNWECSAGQKGSKKKQKKRCRWFRTGHPPCGPDTCMSSYLQSVISSCAHASMSRYPHASGLMPPCLRVSIPPMPRGVMASCLHVSIPPCLGPHASMSRYPHASGLMPLCLHTPIPHGCHGLIAYMIPHECIVSF